MRTLTLTLRPLLRQRLRFVLTVAGIALCVVLMLFLQAIYRGVRLGSVEYVARTEADLWVLQRGQTNVLRGTSLLPDGLGRRLRAHPGVAGVAPVLFLLAAVEVPGGTSTLYLTGFEPERGVGGPPALAAGRLPRTDAEIVLDESFARKFGFRPGREIRVGDERLLVTGLSKGTNMFVIQYAFTTLGRVRALMGHADVTSAWLLRLDDGADAAGVAAALRAAYGVEAYDHDTFVANNVREMESGFLPILYAIAVLGAVVLAAVLSLILSVDVVERRQTFAVMKAVGAPSGFVPLLVVRQAALLAGLGVAVAVALFAPLQGVIERAAPELSLRSSATQVVATATAVLAIGLVSSLLPIQRLRRVYALEVFR